jgi:hypothetical protein
MQLVGRRRNQLLVVGIVLNAPLGNCTTACSQEGLQFDSSVT